MKTQKVTVIDVETSALPEDILEPLLPKFKPPANTKDPAKLAEKEKEHYATARDEAALDPLTGMVVAIGILELDMPLNSTDFAEGLIEDRFTILTGDEKDILKQCFGILDTGEARLPLVVSFNGHGFDWPFLFKRAYIIGIRPPGWLRNGRWWSQNSIDLREMWNFGDRYAPGDLDRICRACGLPGKNGSGKDFAKLLKEDREKAIAYLNQDLASTAALYRRMCA